MLAALTAGQLWSFLPVGYLLTVLVEAPLLLLMMSPQVTWRARLLYGLWLTACTYPIVVIVLPLVMAEGPRWQYVLAAETFAPLAECGLFAAAQRLRQPRGSVLWRDLLAIVLANLASFGLGELLAAMGVSLA